MLLHYSTGTGISEYSNIKIHESGKLIMAFSIRSFNCLQAIIVYTRSLNLYTRTLTCHCTGIKSSEDENIIYRNWLLIPVAIETTCST